MAAWSVYVVRCMNGAQYTGITKDVPRRFAEHRAGRGKGAKYLLDRGPLRLVYEKEIGRLHLALRVERRIKKGKTAGDGIARRTGECVRALPAFGIASSHHRAITGLPEVGRNHSTLRIQVL